MDSKKVFIKDTPYTFYGGGNPDYYVIEAGVKTTYRYDSTKGGYFAQCSQLVGEDRKQARLHSYY